MQSRQGPWADGRQLGSADPLVPSHRQSNGHSGTVQPLRDFGVVPLRQQVELVVLRFLGFGRLAHFRRSLLALPHVTAARITGYAEQTAFFTVTLAPGTP